MLGIRRVDRYVAREVLGPLAIGFSLFTFLLLMNAFFLVAQQTISKNLGWDLAFRMFALELPRLLVLTVPMATLFGCLIGLGRLSADHEWVALQSAGRGAGVLVRPLALVGLAGTLLCLALYWEVAPRSNFAQRHLRGEVILASNSGADLTPRMFYSQLDGLVLFIDEIDPGRDDGRVEGVFVHRQGNERGREQLILAREGRFRARDDGSGDVHVELWDAISYEVDPADPADYTIQRASQQGWIHPAPAFLRALRSPPDAGVYDMNARDLIREIREAPAETDAAIRAIRMRSAALELHMRIALPVACLIFALLSVPLGLTRARSGKGAGFALSIGVILLYYVVFITGKNLAFDGTVPAWLGVWAANLVLLPWLAIGLLRLRRPGAEDRGIVPSVRRAGAALFHLARSWSPARVENPELDDEAETRPEALPHRHGGRASRIVARLDQYVGRQYLRTFLLTLVGTYLLFVIVEMRQLVGDVVKTGLPPAVLLEYFAYYAPGMLPYTLPVACLTAGVVAVTVLSRTGELTAIKASGISVRRTTVPLVAITVVLCAAFFVVQDRIAPATNQKRLELKDRIEDRSPRTYGLPPGGGWIFGADGSHLYHYGFYDDARVEFRDLSILTLDRETFRFRDHRHADRATWDGDAWVLRDVWRRNLPVAPGEPSSFEWVAEDTAVGLDPPTHFADSAELLDRRSRVADQMNVEELSDRIRALEQSGYDTTRLEVAYHAKFAQPMSPLVMLLLGLPFAFRVGRRGSLYGIGVSILLVIVYWATLATFQALGLETILPPVLAAWAPNILYGLLGSYLLLYVRT